MHHTEMEPGDRRGGRIRYEQREFATSPSRRSWSLTGATSHLRKQRSRRRFLPSVCSKNWWSEAFRQLTRERNSASFSCGEIPCPDHISGCYNRGLRAPLFGSINPRGKIFGSLNDQSSVCCQTVHLMISMSGEAKLRFRLQPLSAAAYQPFWRSGGRSSSGMFW